MGFNHAATTGGRIGRASLSLLLSGTLIFPLSVGMGIMQAYASDGEEMIHGGSSELTSQSSVANIDLLAAELYSWPIGKNNPQDVIATYYADGTLQFSGSGDMVSGYSYSASVGNGRPPWVPTKSGGDPLPNINVKRVVFENGVTPTNLDYYFESCYDLTSVENIPSSVKSMEFTFQNCSSLKAAPTLPQGVQSLRYSFAASGLTSVPTIPSSVKSLEATFYYCEDLTTANVAIPSSVETVRNLFVHCEKLKQAPQFSEGIKDFNAAFSGCSSLVVAPKIPKSATNISGMFRCCSSLKEVSLEGLTVENLNDTFSDCVSLKVSPQIPQTVKDLNGTFKNCTALTEAPLIPAGITGMEATFQNCTALTMLPEGFSMGAATWTNIAPFELAWSATPLVTYCSKADYARLSTYNWSTSYTKLVALADLKDESPSIPDQIYTGNAVLPKTVVLKNGTVLRLGIDYTATATNNVALGTATAQIIGLKQYRGTVSLTFNIVSADTSELKTVIRVADASLKATVESNDGVASTAGEELTRGTYWASPAAKKALAEAIEKANLAQAKVPSSEKDISTAVSALETAILAFEKTRQRIGMEPEPILPQRPDASGSGSKDPNEENKTGEETEVVENPDGTTVTTVTNYDNGTIVVTTAYPSGVNKVDECTLDEVVVSSKYVIPKTAVQGEVVALPVESMTEGDNPLTLEAPLGAKIGIPLAEENNNALTIVATDGEGNKQVITKSICNGSEMVFLMPSKECTIHLESPDTSFSDVSDDDWFAKEGVVDYTVSRGLITGVTCEDGSAVFNGQGSMTRAMFVTILHRLEGCPETISSKDFFDVSDDAWYQDAVAWAAARGIIEGYAGTGLFGPNDPITREQMAVVMNRFAGYMGANVAPRADISQFKDASQLSFGQDAMKWAVAVDVIHGNGSTGLLSPSSKATRAEASAMLMRLMAYRLK